MASLPRSEAEWRVYNAWMEWGRARGCPVFKGNIDIWEREKMKMIENKNEVVEEKALVLGTGMKMEVGQEEVVKQEGEKREGKSKENWEGWKKGWDQGSWWKQEKEVMKEEKNWRTSEDWDWRRQKEEWWGQQDTREPKNWAGYSRIGEKGGAEEEK